MNIYDRLMKLHISPRQRAFLDWVEKGWYVETEPDRDGMVQSGTVVSVIRDRFQVPVCLRIQNDNGQRDCISTDHIVFFEPYREFDFDYNEYDEKSDKEEYYWQYSETKEGKCL